MDLIRLRLVSPPHRTDRVAAALAADPCVLNLAVRRDAIQQPPGDLLECDLLQAAADRVLATLRALEVDRHGSLTADPVALALSEHTDAVAARLPRRLSRAPVWAAVEARIRADAAYTPSFLLLLVVAGVIGAVGLLTNSQILIVAAMILGPEYGAITGVALGLDRGERRLAGRGMLALTVGFTLAVLAAYAFTLLVSVAGLVPEAFARGIRPVSHLIYTPDFYSVTVALLAGIAGVVALAHTRSSALIGVFVSVTTIPAAADVGVSLAVGSPGQAGGSLVQLLLNIAILIVTGFATLRAQRAMWARVARRHPGG
ncbi:DUF389 domain-containing protein [Catellatospora bangladeshensis]|uniref:Membrane protein n=1 Tax=Catellatospora bangladeshensis TaxID=310355 RepID=A0A8J3NGF6_9ACTN|nr:DUF389 domain-containing protein [Catellatospora bangladeshensis]GIF80335.1 membrane protein [Catellatospora bangladeshensis]